MAALKTSRKTPVLVPDGWAPALGIVLLVGGLLSIIASFALTIEKLDTLAHPDAPLACNINTTFQCGTNLDSPQGRVFGFPNSLLGLILFPAPIVLGIAILGGCRFPRWFWMVFQAGHLFAISFVGWLAFQSVFVLHTLCPWCALVYVAVVPMFVGVTFATLSGWSPDSSTSRWARRAGGWSPLICVLLLAGIFVVAQVRVNFLGL